MALIAALGASAGLGHTLASWSADATLTDHRIIAAHGDAQPLEIEIDVRQTLNPGEQGQVMVDLLAIDPFDPMEVAGNTLRFGPPGAEAALPTHVARNLTGTNHPRADRVRRIGFPVAATGLQVGDAGCIVGELEDGTPVTGCTALSYAATTEVAEDAPKGTEPHGSEGTKQDAPDDEQPHDERHDPPGPTGNLGSDGEQSEEERSPASSEPSLDAPPAVDASSEQDTPDAEATSSETEVDTAEGPQATEQNTVDDG